MFDVIKKQEETRQVELAAKSAEFKAMQAQFETVRSLYFCFFIIGCTLSQVKSSFRSLNLPDIVFALDYSNSSK